MTPDQIEALFTRSTGKYAFARWRRPVAPVVFGVQNEVLGIIKGAVEAVAQLSGLETSETDPELGSNLMFFFLKDWDELLNVRDLGRLVPELTPLVARLQAAHANQYRLFRFETSGAIQACFVFIRMDEQLSEMPVETLILGQVVQSILLWSDTAFSSASPLALLPNGTSVLRPEIADIIRAAYDPVLPDAAQDVSHGLRVFARMESVT